MGFDVICIPNIEAIPREHFCPVCKLLINPNEALQSMCGHLFCKPCLAYVTSTTRVCPYDGYLVTETDAKPLAESNKALAETIAKTVVNCLYQNSGCTWQGSLSDSSSHCSECAFSSSLVICYWCGTQVAHRQGQEHVRVCPVQQQLQMQAYTQTSIDLAISQVSAQGHGVAAATLTQDQWYQQQYQQYYQNYTRYFMHQPSLHLPGLAPQNASQHQLPYIQPAAQYAAQIHPQIRAQSQLQSQSLVLHQPHVVFSSAPHLGAALLPQAYPSVPPHPQHPCQTFPASQGLHNLQAQAHSQTKHLSQTHHLTNSQVPQRHQFHGQIQNPMHPHDTVQNSPPYAYWTGKKLSPQPNQRNKVEVPPENMPVSHQVGTQTPQVQKHPQTLEVHQPKMNLHSDSASQVGSGQAAPSLPAVKEVDIQRTQNQVPQESWGQDKVPLQCIFWKQGIEAILDGSEARSTSGVKPAVEVTTVKFDHKHKGKHIDACVESLHRSSIIVEGNERKSGPLGKQVMEESVENGRKNVGKSILIEKKGTESGPSQNGTPLIDPVLLEEYGLRYLNILHQQYLSTAYLHSKDVERSGDYSSGSLDRGFDQRSPVRPNKKHELNFELRPASRFSQPSIDLGEREVRRGPRSLIGEHLGMPSHGYGPLDHGLGGSRAKTTDIDGTFRFGLLRSEYKGDGNLQREKVQDADVSGPVDNNGLWPRDVGFKNRYTLQGSSGDGGSFPGDLGSNSRKWTTAPVECTGLHSQTKDHQQSVDMDVVIKQIANKLKIPPGVTSPFCNQNKNEERRFGGLG